MDIVTEKVYLLAFLVQMIMVVGIIYTALLYTSINNPAYTASSGLKTQTPRIGVVGLDMKFEGLRAFKLESADTSAIRDLNLVALVIAPENMNIALQNGENVEITIILDNTNILSGYADAVITRHLQKLSEKIKKERISRIGDAEAILNPIFIEKTVVGEEKKIFFDSPKFIELMYGFLMPFILLLPTFLSMNMTTDSIVGEKEKKTYEILISTPLTKKEIMLGKVLPILLISDIQALVWIFILQVKSIVVFNIPLIILFLTLLNLSFIGVGVIISAFSDTNKDADIGVTLSIILFSLIFFAPLSLGKNIYTLSPLAVLSKLASNPVVNIYKIIPIYFILFLGSIAIICLGGRLLEWKENLRL